MTHFQCRVYNGRCSNKLSQPMTGNHCNASVSIWVSDGRTRIRWLDLCGRWSLRRMWIQGFTESVGGGLIRKKKRGLDFSFCFHYWWNGDSRAPEIEKPDRSANLSQEPSSPRCSLFLVKQFMLVNVGVSQRIIGHFDHFFNSLSLNESSEAVQV